MSHAHGRLLIGQMTDDARPDPAVVAAAWALARGSRVAEVADRLGLLPRTLRRRFTAQMGLTPKRFGRVQRLQRLVRGLDGQIRVDWAATAARHGYCDQAHLADEFQELVGVSPAGYLRSRVNGPNHLRFDVAHRIAAFTGPDDVVWTEAAEPSGGVVVDVAAAGVSFADLLQTRGAYQMRVRFPTRRAWTRRVWSGAWCWL